MYIPHRTIKLIRDEFLKELKEYSVKEFSHDDNLSVLVIDDSLVLSIEIVGWLANGYYREEEYAGNPYLDLPIASKEFYKLQIAELTPNEIGFKHNHTSFLNRMKKLFNIRWLLPSIVSYAHFNTETAFWWNPDGPHITERVNELFPELELKERIGVLEGDLYNFIVLELFDSDGKMHRAVAYTMQSAHSYVNQACQTWIKSGRLHGVAINSGIVEIDMESAFASWKGIRSQQRLEEHLQ